MRHLRGSYGIVGSARLVEKMRQVIQRIAPEIALILDIGLQQAECGLIAFRVYIFDGSQGGRHIGKSAPGQEVADIDGGSHAPVQAPIAFKIKCLADSYRAMRALGFRRLDWPGGDIDLAQSGVSLRRDEVNVAMFGRQLQPLPDRQHNRAAECSVGERVGNHPDTCLLTHPSQGGRGHDLQGFVALLPIQRQWHEVQRILVRLIQPE